MESTTQSLNLAVPLALEAHTRSKQFLKKHKSDPEKAKQSYLNTLAIYAIEFYLCCRGYQTDWKASDSADVIMQTFMNVADLVIKGHGKVECRPILPNSESMYVPQEVWSDRIAYIAVQLDESLREATILGFVEKVETENIPLDELKTLDDLPCHINQFREEEAQQTVENTSTSQVDSIAKSINKLLQWMQWNFSDAIQVGWTPEFKPVYRSTSNESSSQVKESLINQLQITQDEKMIIEIAENLGLIDTAKSEALDTLTNVIQSTQNETNRWNAALAIGKIEPNHPKAAICLFKLIHLGSQELKLRTAIRSEINGKFSILLGVYSANSKEALSPELKFAVLDEFGNTVIEESHKDYIQSQIEGEAGEKFSVQLTLGYLSEEVPFEIK